MKCLSSSFEVVPVAHRVGAPRKEVYRGEIFLWWRKCSYTKISSFIFICKLVRLRGWIWWVIMSTRYRQAKLAQWGRRVKWRTWRNLESLPRFQIVYMWLWRYWFRSRFEYTYRWAWGDLETLTPTWYCLLTLVSLGRYGRKGDLLWFTRVRRLLNLR